MTKKKICFVASTGIPSFHRTNIERLATEFDVYAVMNITDSSAFDGIDVKEAYNICIERRPSIIKDFRALWLLYRYFKRNRFDVFVSQASKPSLLASIAGIMAGIPVRIRIFTGQLWANKKGFGRAFFKAIDKFTVMLNTHILVDGKSQRHYLIENKILKENQAVVLANGSICGVNTRRFVPSEETRKEIREALGIGSDDIVFAFMGRINREKGIFELLSAFNSLSAKYNNAKLVLIGSREGISDDLMASYPNIRIGENLILYGYTKEPHKTLQVADVFCLPSYREGFGMSAIEAAALQLPVICSDAYGLADAFVDGVTGLKCKVMDVDSLYSAMETFVLKPDIIKQYGVSGRRRVVEKFNKELVSEAWYSYIKSKIDEVKSE